jgi:CubicO group peptidase (beta-lactamase class C family)
MHAQTVLNSVFRFRVFTINQVLVIAAIFLLSGSSIGLADKQGSESHLLDETRLTDLFNEAVEISGAVGVQLSLIRDGQQLDFVHGLANSELNIPLTQDTVIQIGSSTKIFNAAIAMTLVEEGKLDLDVPIRTYLPEFTVADEVATATITLRHLLSMSSGLDNGPYDDHGVGGDALANYVASLTSLPQAFEPGQGFGYSNAGTTIAGYASERVAGKAWDELLKERILNPAGLNNAASLEKDLLFQRVSVGHAVDPETGTVMVIRPWHITRAQAPAGSTLAMSAHDLARFGQLFINDGKSDSGEQVLSTAVVNTMTTPYTPVPARSFAGAWGIGPYQFEWSGTEIWGHAGGNMSGTSDLRWIPALNGVMAVTCNTPAAYGRFLKVVYEAIMPEAFGVVMEPLQRPENPPVIANPERFTGTYGGVGGSYRVEIIDDRQLKMTFTSEQFPETTVILLSLGGDRFFVDPGEAGDPLVLDRDMAFFGRDASGRATTLLPGPFAFGRSD